jgi:DNA-binding beta-propeller fold protein YncE
MMDFQRQCRRLLNYRIITNEQFGHHLNDISALAIFSNKTRASAGNPSVTIHKFVITDNGTNRILIIDESTGQLVKECQIKNLKSFGICCTNKPKDNFIYVSDYGNNVIHKLDENLNPIKKLNVTVKNKAENSRKRRDTEFIATDTTISNLKLLNGPCGIGLNSELDQLQVVDQKNCRIVYFDLKSDEYVSEFDLFQVN